MILTWPDYCVSSFRWQKSEQAAAFKSIFGSQSVTISLPLWRVDLTGVPTLWEDADEITLFLESLSGFTNQIALWNLTRPVPKGTLRGTLSFAADAAQGALSIVIAGGVGQADATLLAGDMIGFGTGPTQQVVRVVNDAAADAAGDIVVDIGTPLRNDFLADAPVEWDRPKALFRQTAFNEGIMYQPKIGQPWTLSLLEDWRT